MTNASAQDGESKKQFAKCHEDKMIQRSKCTVRIMLKYTKHRITLADGTQL